MVLTDKLVMINCIKMISSYLDVTTSLIFTAIFLLGFNVLRKQSWRNLPPGPPCLPILGSLPFFGKADIREPLHQMSKKYGDLFTVYLGSMRVVVLSSYDVMKEALMRESFTDRPPIFFVTAITEGEGVVSASGSLWRDHRRFTLNTLKDFGLGKSILEEKIHEEIRFFLDAIEMHKGKQFNPKILIMFAVSNIIGSLTFGKRLDYDSEKFRHYMQLTIESFEVVGGAGALTVFPWLQHIPGDFFKCKKVVKLAEYMRAQFTEMMEEHKGELNVEDEPRDVIDAYLREIRKKVEEDGTTFTERQLIRIVGDLYGAGTETTSTTLRWGILYMLDNPNVLEKVQAEIDDVMGPNRLPTMSDRRNMPYTEATLSEIQRMADIVPFSVPHYTSEDAVLKDFFIPENTVIFPNLYSIHRNEEYFKKPYEFNPSRFIAEDGSYKPIKQLIPFGIGRRACLGEGLARMEVFLFFTCLFQRFKVSLPADQKMPSLKGTLTITNEPPAFEAIFTHRH